MARFEWVALCAIVAGVLGWQPGEAGAQFGGGGQGGQFGGGEKSTKQSAKTARENVRALMRGAEAPTDKTSAELCRCIAVGSGEAAAKIKQRLNQPLISAGMVFSDTPLDEVVQVLQEDYDIPIELDIPALDNAGLGPDEPVTISLRGISLRSALRLLLKQLQLTYIIQDEVLKITTPEEAEAQLAVCVYDVGDLIGPKGQATEALIDAILECIETDTWAQHGGGEAEIRPMPPRFLIISQTQAVHEEINDLLATLRTMRGGEQAEGASTTAVIDPQPTLLIEPEPTPFAE